ncbi:AgrD family cyclic lactone autoinducer peptide [Sutcliffiella horikoshii]
MISVKNSSLTCWFLHYQPKFLAYVLGLMIG